MWISILNYNMGQIEVADVTKYFAENETTNQKVKPYYHTCRYT